MTCGALPRSTARQAEEKRRADFREKLLVPFQALKDLGGAALMEVLERQRKSFAAGGTRDEDTPVNSEDEAATLAPHEPRDCPAVQPAAKFVPSSEFRRPSDYVAHLVRVFEKGKEHETNGSGRFGSVQEAPACTAAGSAPWPPCCKTVRAGSGAGRFTIPLVPVHDGLRSMPVRTASSSHWFRFARAPPWDHQWSHVKSAVGPPVVPREIRRVTTNGSRFPQFRIMHVQGSCRFAPVPVHTGSGPHRFWFRPVHGSGWFTSQAGRVRTVSILAPVPPVPVPNGSGSRFGS